MIADMIDRNRSSKQGKREKGENTVSPVASAKEVKVQ
jgi:hypothetical protein